MQKVSAFASILHDAGLSWASADEVDRHLALLNVPGCTNDDVAAVLLAWRRKHARSRLAECRVKAGRLAAMQPAIAALNAVSEIDQVLNREAENPDQLQLFLESVK